MVLTICLVSVVVIGTCCLLKNRANQKWISKVGSRGGSRTRSLDGPFLVAKESNQAKSGIGRSRSLRLDSSPVWSRGSGQGLSRRQICRRQIFGAIDHRTRIHKV